MIVGYKLLRISDGAVVQEWGGVYGSCPGFPNPIVLPSGDHVHAGALDTDYQGHKVVAWMLGPSAVDVKTEARRRILGRYPEWMQNNMVARSAELHRIQSGMMRTAAGDVVAARQLTDIEIAEEKAISAAWDWIKRVRTASNGIEALDPIPEDFADDSRWPL